MVKQFNVWDDEPEPTPQPEPEPTEASPINPPPGKERDE